MKTSFILDPLWITKGNYLDAEYFDYVLLAASMKYKAEIELTKFDHFDEVLFHILNLNNLAVDGDLFTAKLKAIIDNPRINLIRKDLKTLYDVKADTIEICKNANFVFLNVMLDYMSLQLDILDKVKIFYMNQKIHREKEIFVLTNRHGSYTYRIWKLAEDRKQNFGYSFSKIRTIDLPQIKENMLRDELDRVKDPQLSAISGMKNLCFAVIEEKEDERKVAKAVKNLMLLNKGIAKSSSFEPLMFSELYQHLWIEKIMPFTLNQWVFQKA